MAPAVPWATPSQGKLPIWVQPSPLSPGPVALSPDGPWELINVNSAAEMFVAMTSRSADQDLIIMTAAVGDYQPVEFSPTKIKKADKNLVLELGRTQDILRHLGDTKPAGQVLVGFALETNDEEAPSMRWTK